MRVRLIRKLANSIDGVDLTARQVGDTLEIPASEARILLAEEWAIRDSRSSNRRAKRASRKSKS
jgi:hypothetical protein